MRSANGDSADHPPQTPSEGEARSLLRVEAGRVVLSNSLLQLAFSLKHHGSLVSIRHLQKDLDLTDPEEAAAEGALWRLQLAAADGETVALTARDAADFSHSVDESGPEADPVLRLRWTGLRARGAAIEGGVEARVVLPSGSASALFEIELQLPGHLSVAAVEYPCLCALGSPDPILEEALFLPIGGGLLVQDPAAALSGRQPPRLEATYPGPSSLQLLGYCCGTRVTAWLASLDATGARKTLLAVPAAHSPRLTLAIAHHPDASADGRWTVPYPTAVGLVAGDWFEAARAYRAWAVEQPWSARGAGAQRALPALTAYHGLWASYWGGARGALETARELQRLVNIPIKLDWRCWHHCSRGGAYPDYLPPRDGDQAFQEVRRQLAESGVLSQLSVNGLLASPESQAWQSEQGEAYALSPDPGAAAPQLSLGLHTGLTPMCPATDYWRSKLASLAAEIVARGAHGLHFEHLATSAPMSCRSDAHGHPPFTPNRWAAAIAAALARLRQTIGDAVQLAADGPCELYVGLTDAFWSAHPALEREGLLPDLQAVRCSAIPLFPSVYHGYATLVGPALSLANQRPHDPEWEERVVADLARPAPVMAGDYTSQFCLEVARGLVWGYQLLLDNFALQQTRQEENRRKLAFLAAALRSQAWGTGALIPYSEFMGLLEIACPGIDVDLLVNPPGSSPSDRRALRRRVQPVLGAAWRTPGSGAALVLVNIHHKPVDFSTRLQTSRLPLMLPLEFMGRTFSEDGDIPGATLRTLGTDLSGRIPGRSIVLVSAR